MLVKFPEFDNCPGGRAREVLVLRQHMPRSLRVEGPGVYKELSGDSGKNGDVEKEEMLQQTRQIQLESGAECTGVLWAVLTASQ